MANPPVEDRPWEKLEVEREEWSEEMEGGEEREGMGHEPSALVPNHVRHTRAPN